MPKFEVPEGHTMEITEYSRTSKEEVAERIKDATVLVTTIVPLDAHLLSEEVCPDLEFIDVMASGVDTIDLATCRRRGIVVSSVNTANVVSVSEHAIAMYFAARRMFTVAGWGLRRNVWVQEKAMLPLFRDGDGNGPPVCEEETVGVIGYGPIGELSALSMLVLYRSSNHRAAPR
jgi:lactate dehydrogenase-like 2-hydroxyacid dehydrogenase